MPHWMTRHVTGFQLAVALLVFDAAVLAAWPLLPTWLRGMWSAVVYLPLLLTCLLGVLWSGFISRWVWYAAAVVGSVKVLLFGLVYAGAVYGVVSMSFMFTIFGVGCWILMALLATTCVISVAGWVRFFRGNPWVPSPRSSDSDCVPCPTCGYDLRATPVRCPECGRTAA